MTSYEETLRNEVVFDLGSEVIGLFKRAVKLHGADPDLASMMAAAMVGAIEELDITIPRFQECICNVLAD